MRRTATQDTTVGGRELHKGDKLIMFYNSANRDESVFTDPDVFDVTRSPNPHFGFGARGPHFCLGAHLARREITVAFRALFERGDAAKYIDLPLSNYSTWPNDKVLLDGRQVGVSTFSGYSYNERSMLSLTVLDVDVEGALTQTRGHGRSTAPGRAKRSG